MMKKRNLKFCIIAMLVFAGLLDIGMIILIGTYDYQFFWMYLIVFAIYYSLGAVGTIKEYYLLLYMFAAFIILYRCVDIALRLMEIIHVDPTQDEETTKRATVRKRDIIINSDGRCCLTGLHNFEKYVVPSCCHDNPIFGDPLSKICQKLGFGAYAFRCQKKVGQLRSSSNMESIETKDKLPGTKKVSVFIIFYCLRTIVDIILLFLVFVLAYTLQFKG